MLIATAVAAFLMELEAAFEIGASIVDLFGETCPNKQNLDPHCRHKKQNMDTYDTRAHLGCG